MRKLILFLLLPGLLLAQTEKKVGNLLTVKQVQTAKAETPPHMVKRMGKQTDCVTVYQDSAHFARKEYDKGRFKAEISSVPIRWNDAGTLKDFDLAPVKSSRAGYDQRVRMGKTTVDIDSTGRVYYEKGGQGFEIIPNAATAEIRKEVEFSTTRMKELLIVGAKDPRHLGWRINGDIEIARRKIEPFTAWDRKGKPVEVSGKWMGDSLTVDLPAGEIWLDPTVNDTIISASSGGFESYVNATFAENRDDPSASMTAQQWGSVGQLLRTGGGDAKTVCRVFMTIKVPTIVGVIIDSGRVHIRVGNGNQMVDSLSVFGVWGTWTGGVLSITWWNKFQGQQTGAPHTSVNPFSDLIHVSKLGDFEDSLAWKSALFTAAALDTIAAKMDGVGDDSVRIALIGRADMYNSGAVGQATWEPMSYPYISLFYHIGSAPGLSTLADSARASAILVGKIDSTGGLNCTSRGFEWWIDADTTEMSKSGSFTAGAFQDTIEVLPIGVTVSYRCFAENPKGKTYGDVKTFTTGAGGGGDADTIYINTRATSTGRGPRRFEGKR
jgi:hypothetical protein